MTETKDKIVSLELLKVYHDYNEENYSKPIHLTFDGSVIRDSENSALSFSQIFSMTSDKTISVDVLNDSRVMLCINNSSSAIDFIDLHVTGGKYFIGWLSIGNDNRVAYKDVGIALSGDIVKNLSQMVGDATHRTVTDEQINTWNNKSDFSGDWADLANKPIATVAQTKQFLSIQ